MNATLDLLLTYLVLESLFGMMRCKNLTSLERKKIRWLPDAGAVPVGGAEVQVGAAKIANFRIAPCPRE